MAQRRFQETSLEFLNPQMIITAVRNWMSIFLRSIRKLGNHYHYDPQLTPLTALVTYPMAHGQKKDLSMAQLEQLKILLISRMWRMELNQRWTLIRPSR